MSDTDADPLPAKPEASRRLLREARLKSALKANLARRKAQARARAEGDAERRQDGAENT